MAQPLENPWAGVTTETGLAAGALDCGSFPLPSEATDSLVTYAVSGVNDLEAYRVCSEANQTNVDEHAAQILQLKVARAALVDAGRAQRNIAQMRAEMLEDERKHHFWQSIGYWIAIAAMGMAL